MVLATMEVLIAICWRQTVCWTAVQLAAARVERCYLHCDRQSVIVIDWREFLDALQDQQEWEPKTLRTPRRHAATTLYVISSDSEVLNLEEETTAARRRNQRWAEIAEQMTACRCRQRLPAA